MLKLHTRLPKRWDAESLVGRITTNQNLPTALRDRQILLVRTLPGVAVDGFACALVLSEDASASQDLDGSTLMIPSEFQYLTDGDIVRLEPRTGYLRVLYRKNSRYNYFFFTERCNSYCVMCSQPPRQVDDRHLLIDFINAIPLIDESTEQLGITGGECTLYPELLLDLLRKCKSYLPDTRLHALSNGRKFSYLSLASAVRAVNHPHLTFGIPLYSDIAHLHDFVVQVKGAFDETVRGIMNLERCGQRVEIRVVLHRHTVDRLPQLARFIARNFPFVDHVALMGLEMMGFTKMNINSLWIDPLDYQQQLSEAVQALTSARLNVSIYNHQLCTLPTALHGYAVQSISDWKNEYLPVCAGCQLREKCGGFFSSTKSHVSRGISPVQACN